MSTPESRAQYWRDFANDLEILADAIGDLPTDFETRTKDERKHALFERVRNLRRCAWST